MTAWMGLFTNVVLPALMIVVLGIGIGGYNERKHFRSLARREKHYKHIRVNNLKRIDDASSCVRGQLVIGSVVIATDTFKSFVTGLRNLVGGEMKAAQKLLVRARREALLRMLAEADTLGSNEVWNVRFGFSNISQMRGRGGGMQVELYAYGTAVVRQTS